MVDDGDAVAEDLRFVHVVGRENDRSAERFEFGDQIPELPSRLWVEAGRRLVEKDQIGIADDRAGERESLLLSAGQFADAPCALLIELDEGNDVVDGATAIVEAAKQTDRFFHRELVGELCFLKLNAESFAELVLVAIPAQSQQLDVAGVGVGEAFADLDRRRLSGAVWAEQAETLAWRHIEIESVDSAHVAKVFAQIANE